MLNCRVTDDEHRTAIMDARLPAPTLDGYCGASADDPHGWIGTWFAEREVFCTRQPHTDGIHAGRGTDGRIVRVWREGER